MNINDMMRISIERAKRWHNDDTGLLRQWTTLEWAGAMCGEAGETANAAKKLRRIEQNLMSINESARSLVTIDQAREVVIREVCDTVLYAVLVAASAGCKPEDFEDYLISTFNKKSEEYGFPERLYKI